MDKSHKTPCSVPGCQTAKPLEDMWIPALQSLARANSGRPVPSHDLPKFAVCGHHGHLLRRQGVMVYRFLPTLELVQAREAKRQAEAASFDSFAARFKTPGNGKGKGPKPDFTQPGMGLARCAKQDANKRPAKPESEELPC